MSAIIVNHLGDEVLLERENGRTFRVKPSLFSDGDQQYLKNLAVEELIASDRLFSISSRKENVSSTEKDTAAYRLEKKMVAYQITLGNLSKLDFENLKIKYRLYIERFSPGKVGDKESKQVIEKGELVNVSVTSRSETELLTKEIYLNEYELQNGYYWGNGADRSIKDKLVGIVFKVVNSQNKVLYEYATTDRLRDKVNW